MTSPRDRTEGRIEARIEDALAQLGAEHEPPAGWEDRVLAAVREPRRRPWWRIAVPAFTLAAAAAVVVVVWPHEPAALALEVQADVPGLVRGPARRAGDAPAEAQPLGAVVRVQVSGGAKHRAIRVYRNEIDLVLRCPEDPVCRVSGETIAVAFTLSKVGSYQIVAFASSAALPALPGTYDGDTAAAQHAGAQLRERAMHAM